MSMPRPPRRLEIDTVGNVTVVSFSDTRIVDDLVIQEIGDQLLGLVEDRRHRNLLLNFGRVHALSSAALAKLFSLRQKVASIRGKLKFCCVHPELMEVFQLHRPKGSDPLFEIYPEEQKALDSF